jgi:hypothetical protein
MDKLNPYKYWGLELWRDAGKLALLFGPNGNRSFFPYQVNCEETLW